MAMSKLHRKFSRAYENARETSKVREAVLQALVEVFPDAGATMTPLPGEGEPERHWRVSVILPGGKVLEAHGRTALEAAERLVLDQG